MINKENQYRLKHYILIIIFSITLSFVATDGIRIIVQFIYNLPNDAFSFGYWEGKFWTRIIASVFGCLIGGIAIGTYLGPSGKYPSIIFTLPSMMLWIFVFTYQLSVIESHGFPKLPLILIITIPISGFLGWYGTKKLSDEFPDKNRVFNIKWYHWIWIIPLYFNKVVSVPIYLLLTLWKLDLLYDSGYPWSPIITLIKAPGYFISRMIIFIILTIVGSSIFHNYSLLSEESDIKIWKKSIYIISHIIFLFIAYFLLFGFTKPI